MSNSLPKTMKALVQTEEMGMPAIKEVALPQLQENNVLVKVEYASLVSFDL
jgi:D-arabinose 1-dehydrogenase-like Zn-dependent alcohol dehydrogenase